MRLLRLSEVRRRTGRARSSIYADIQRGTFPQPVKIGDRASAWLEHEIDAWIRARIAATRGTVVEDTPESEATP